MADNEAERDELEAQLPTATEGMQHAVARLPQDAEVHRYLAPLALARATGEVGAGAAFAAGQDLEELLGESAEVAHQGWAQIPRRAAARRGASGRQRMILLAHA